jgi:hypothetical protein
VTVNVLVDAPRARARTRGFTAGVACSLVAEHPQLFPLNARHAQRMEGGGFSALSAPEIALDYLHLTNNR